ncbi:hypothetical protein C5Y93_05510 [Blastopirellula marina]|uniref:Uncharacterized protein n=2 Tax=Blastopirellula marina TaxID=124 RepID=A0A2S8GSV0_9BACT|nr:hypothetical protein C5Y93_05510 [Blastopirellula marina]
MAAKYGQFDPQYDRDFETRQAAVASAKAGRRGRFAVPERRSVGGAFGLFFRLAERARRLARSDAEMPILTGLPKMPARYSQDSQCDHWQFGQMSLAATYLCESVAQVARSIT